jgi:DNA-binding XRE family transcriptional regulator
MARDLEIPDPPPLTDELHEDLRLLERKLSSSIGACYRGADLHDPHAAFEYIRTYAVKFYDTFYEFYSQHPVYEPHWQSTSEVFAFGRILKCIDGYGQIERLFERDPTRALRIKRTISDHAARKEALRNRLKVVIPPPQTAKSALSVFAPLLELPAESPLKRVPRSIQSNLAAQKMEAHRERLGLNQTQFANKLGLDPKTLYKFRKTGKVDKSVAAIIAQEMGTTVEQLLKRSAPRLD